MRAGWRIRRLTDGSAIVARRVGRAFVPLDEDGELRLLATAVRCVPTAYVTPRLLDFAHQAPILVAGATGAWCAAAWRARLAKPSPAQAPAEDAEEEPLDEPDPADLRQAVLDRLLDWIGERRGIHLAEVYSRYRELPGHGHLTEPQIRAALTDHYRIPVRPAVRTPDGVRAGIHRDDLQPLPSPESTTPVADDHNSHVTSTVAA